MKKTISQEHNPALKELEILVGNWEMKLSQASFLPNPSDSITGRLSLDWLQGGAFLAMYMGAKPPQTPDAVWLISRDGSVSDYTVLYYDARKVSRVYQMSFSAGTWKMWRNSADFSQRFEATVHETGHIITGRWEKSGDGAAWEHDFDVTYTKAS